MTNMCDGFDTYFVLDQNQTMACKLSTILFCFEVAAVLDGFSLCVDCAAGTFPELVYSTSLLMLLSNKTSGTEIA